MTIVVTVEPGRKLSICRPQVGPILDSMNVARVNILGPNGHVVGLG